jgi:hypothetical protein
MCPAKGATSDKTGYGTMAICGHVESGTGYGADVIGRTTSAAMNAYEESSGWTLSAECASMSHPVMPAASRAAAAIRQIGEWRPSMKIVVNLGRKASRPPLTFTRMS